MDNDAQKNAWIITFTGRHFYVLEPQAEDVCIEDIAHALSLQCRFTGHIKEFYSVAQHSVLVSHMCPPEDAAWGLLHDASEAYIGDMSSPLKHTPEMSRFRTTEKRIMLAVAEHFGLDPKEPQAVKDADRRMLLSEARDLLGSTTGWYSTYEPFPGKIEPWSPKEAETFFLQRWQELNTYVSVPQADGFSGELHV